VRSVLTRGYCLLPLRGAWWKMHRAKQCVLLLQPASQAEEPRGDRRRLLISQRLGQPRSSDCVS